MRPKTLAEVAQLTMNGDSFDRCLANFLDEFYAAPNPQAFADSPTLLAPSSVNPDACRMPTLPHCRRAGPRPWIFRPDLGCG